MAIQWGVSVVLEHEILGHVVKSLGLVESDGYFGIDLTPAFAFDVVLLDGLDVSESVFGKDLGSFEDEGDGLSHALDDEITMLFEDEFGKEDTLVQFGLLADPVDVGRVELGRSTAFHQQTIIILNHSLIQFLSPNIQTYHSTNHTIT